MRRLLALLFLALPALGQVNVTTAPCKITDESCSRGVTSVPGGTTLAANVHTGTTFRATAPATVTITGATNATPIVVTATAHGLVTGDNISISGITGNTNANGYFKITRLSANTFSLQNYSTGADIAGNGAYGGTPVAVTGIVQANRVLVGDGTAAAPQFATATDPRIGMWINPADGQYRFYRVGGAWGTLNHGGMNIVDTSGAIAWSSGVTLTSAAAATLQLGAANSATHAGVAQTLQVQSNITETDQNAPASFTINGPRGTGTGTSGTIIFQAGTPGTTGGTAHVLAPVLTLANNGSAGTAAPQALFADGTAAKPGLAFASVPNTGMYLSFSLYPSISVGGNRYYDFKSDGFQLLSNSIPIAFGATPDLFLSRAAAATLQLGAANAASPVGQRLRSQGAATGTDIAGADLNISPGPMTGTGANYAAGRYGALRLGTYVPGTTGTTTSTTTTDRLVISGRPITLTAGSATNIVHIDIPALAGASWDITYSVVVTDSAAPVQMKVLGGRYYGSAYRLAAGNAVPNAVTETGDNEVHSVGGACSDVMTFTGDATGVMVAHNITVGTGLTAPNTVVGTYTITISGTGAVTATPR